MKLAEVTSINVNRTKTEMEEFNRVLGGGVVPGSLVLIGGDPGIGKSTLLLQVSTQLSQVGTVLYVSGEESAQQIKLRAERLGDIDSEFYLYAETNMQSVRAEVERIQPDFLIIDSIQTIMSPEISGVQGSVSQVREVTAELMQLAKTNNIAIFIVGHVTKEGTLAGPRMLEHMVDTVLYFEGERHHTFRILRAVKNRFGSTNEIGIFLTIGAIGAKRSKTSTAVEYPVLVFLVYSRGSPNFSKRSTPNCLGELILNSSPASS